MFQPKNKNIHFISNEKSQEEAETCHESTMTDENCKNELGNHDTSPVNFLYQTLKPDDGQLENYINLHHRYPSNYQGEKNEAMLAKMSQDLVFDEKEQILYVPYGRVVKGTFVYLGEKRKILGH